MNNNLLLGAMLSCLFGCSGSDKAENSLPTQQTRPQNISAGAEYLLMQVDWNDRATEIYTSADLFTDFNINDNWYFGIDEGRAAIIEETELQTASNRFLRIHYPQGQYGAYNSGISFRAWLPQLSDTGTTCVSFRVRFKGDFVFSGMGKLGAGLAAGEGVTGGEVADGYNGFTSRPEWQTENNSGDGAGRLAALVYRYNPDSEKPSIKYYAKYTDGSDFIFASNRWYLIEHCITENSIDYQGNVAADGAITINIDGIQVVKSDEFIFRLTPQLTADQLLFTTFFGGASAQYAADRDEHIDYADLNVTAIQITLD
jgi:hypothetical protein